MPLFGSTRYEVSKERPDSVPFAEQACAMGELIRSGKVHSPSIIIIRVARQVMH